MCDLKQHTILTATCFSPIPCHTTSHLTSVSKWKAVNDAHAMPPIDSSDTSFLHAEQFVLDLGQVYKGPGWEKFVRTNKFFCYPCPVGYTASGNAFRKFGPYLEITNTILAGEEGPEFKVCMRPTTVTALNIDASHNLHRITVVAATRSNAVAMLKHNADCWSSAMASWTMSTNLCCFTIHDHVVGRIL